MFRKREMSVFEKSLICEGVMVRSDVGRALLSKMVELGYSDYEVYLKPHDVTPTVLLVLMCKESIDFWLASIEVTRRGLHKDDKSRIAMWWPLQPEANNEVIECDTDRMNIYSIYDIWGKPILDV